MLFFGGTNQSFRSSVVLSFCPFVTNNGWFTSNKDQRVPRRFLCRAVTFLTLKDQKKGSRIQIITKTSKSFFGGNSAAHGPIYFWHGPKYSNSEGWYACCILTADLLVFLQWFDLAGQKEGRLRSRECPRKPKNFLYCLLWECHFSWTQILMGSQHFLPHVPELRKLMKKLEQKAGGFLCNNLMHSYSNER